MLGYAAETQLTQPTALRLLSRCQRRRSGGCAPFSRQAAVEAIKKEIDGGGGVERQDLADDEAADDGDAQRPAEFGTGAARNRQRDGTQQ
jgi:hypothetical protein